MTIAMKQALDKLADKNIFELLTYNHMYPIVAERRSATMR